MDLLDSAFRLEFEAVYLVLTPEMAAHMDRQQAILLSLIEEFERRGIDFAYPTRTLWLKNPPAERNPQPPGP